MTVFCSGLKNGQRKRSYLSHFVVAVVSATILVACNAGSPSFDTAPGTPTPTPTPSPTLSFSASPVSIAAGGASTLTWSSTNATACTASGGWSGSQATTGSQSLTNLTATTTYTLACTGSGGTATQSATVSVTSTADITAPSVPENLSAVAVAASQINLSWSASTDNVAVAGYRIYRGGTLLTTVSSTSYTNTGLSASTPYSYTVSAYDAAGNTSAQSASVSATTPAAGTNPIDSLPAGHWYQVPNSHMRGVAFQWPAGVTYTLNGVGVEGVMDLWNSGAYDTTRDRLVVWGGGHNGYGGNEIYAFDVKTLTWQRVIDPSLQLQADGSAYYADGTPAAEHTYGGMEYLQTADRLIKFPGNGYWGSVSGGPEVNAFNFNTNQWERKADIADFSYSASTVDAATGHAWVKSNAGACYLAEYDPANNSWTTRSDFLGCYTYYTTLAIDSVGRKLVAVGNGSLWVWDISQAGNVTQTSPATTGGDAIINATSPGFVYDPVTGKFVGWNGGADVYVLDPATWTWTKVSPAPTNTATPTNANSSGTYGRFRYIPSKNAFIVVNSVDEDVYIYKLP